MLNIWKEMIFPRRCAVCDQVVSPWGALCCDSCNGKFMYLGEHYCMKCGKGLTKEEKEYCGDCQKHKHNFDRGRSVYRYESVAGAIFRYKYQGRQEYAEYFGRELYEYLQKDIYSMKAEAILPVPLHKKRYRERGYNQAALLAREVSKWSKIPVRESLVVRCRSTVPQKQLNYFERQNNLKKAFKLTVDDVKLNTVIIMDDIYTTGSTIDAISKILRESGVKRIYAITLAAGME